MISPTNSASSGSPAAAQSTTCRPSLRLRFRGGQHDGQVVRINSAKCTIGSAPHATLRLACTGVHPIHCVILSGSEATAIRSLAPDTLLNGNYFDDEQLRPGDVLTLGPLHLEILEPLANELPTARSTDGQPQGGEELQALQNELDALRQQVETERFHSQELSQQLKDVTQQLEAEEARNSEQPERDSDAASLLEELEVLRGQVTQVDSLNQEKQELAEQVADLREQLEQSKTVQASYESEFAAVAEKLTSLEAIQTAYEQLLHEVEQLRTAVEQAEEHRQQWETERSNLESDLAAARHQLTQPADEQPTIPQDDAMPVPDNEALSTPDSNDATAASPMLTGPEADVFVDDSDSQEAALDPVALEPLSHEEQLDSAHDPFSEQPSLDPSPDPSPEHLEPETQAAESPLAADTLIRSENESVAQNATMAMNDLDLGFGSQTMCMDDVLPVSDAVPAPSEQSEQSSTDTISQTMIFEEGTTFANTPQSDAMAMLDKLRAELGVPAGQTESETDESAAEAPSAVESSSEASPDSEAPPYAVEATVPISDAFTAGPSSPDEIEYSQPESAAPVDTASILAKFGHSAETMSLEEPEPNLAPEPIQDREPIAPAPSFADDEDDDGSIQDYMAQLMQRVGGSDGLQPSQEKPKAPKQVAAPKSNPVEESKPAAQAKSESPGRPLDPSEFVPRAVAPEATSGLKALRAVANTSTRSAIDRHQRRSLDTKAIMSGFIALVAFAVAVAMGYLALDAESWFSIPIVISLSSGFVGILAAIKALAYSARAALTSRRQQNLKQLSAR